MPDPATALEDLNPLPRLLMGPGPINADPRVLRAMSAQLLGQFDPQFRGMMRETMALYRRVFETANDWTFIVDGIRAQRHRDRAGVGHVEPGERVLVCSFGRFGQLFSEIARRAGAEVKVIDAAWGTVFDPEQIEAAVRQFAPALVTICQGDTSTTMCQPLDEIGRICHRHGALLQVDATASIGGTPLKTDAWEIDCVTAGSGKNAQGFGPPERRH